MKNRNLIQWIEWALRINVFLKINTYAIGKMLGGQFYTPGNIPQEIAIVPLGETESYNLAWTFFGHSKGYILFIGIAQLMGATLFLFNRTKLIGGAILLPILMNIIIVDALFGVAYGALFSACFYLLSVLFVCYLNRGVILNSLRKLFLPRLPVNKKERLVKALAIVGIFAFVFFVEYYLIGVFGYDDR